MLMKQKLLIVVAVIVIILLGAVGSMLMSGNKKPAAPETTMKKTETNPITSIQDAISKNMSLECDYTSATGTEVKAYIKNGKVKSEITGKTPAESSTSIMMDKKIYFWGAQGGFMMDMPEITITPGANVTNVPNKGKETLDSLEQYKSSCKQAAISDSEFDLPKDVKFQDMSKMMPSGAMMQKTAPSGAQTAPSGVTKEQVEEMMKKYVTPTQ